MPSNVTFMLFFLLPHFLLFFLDFVYSSISQSFSLKKHYSRRITVINIGLEGDEFCFITSSFMWLSHDPYKI
jgi:hypothetical protein